MTCYRRAIRVIVNTRSSYHSACSLTQQLFICSLSSDRVQYTPTSRAESVAKTHYPALVGLKSMVLTNPNNMPSKPPPSLFNEGPSSIARIAIFSDAICMHCSLPHMARSAIFDFHLGFDELSVCIIARSSVHLSRIFTCNVSRSPHSQTRSYPPQLDQFAQTNRR